jgi:hypothetical protein
MIKPIFRFFQVQIESVLRHADELLQAAFGTRSKTFDAIYMRTTIDEFISRVIDPQMFFVADINQSIVAAPLFQVNDRIQADTPANKGLQRLFLTIRDNPGINRTVAFEDAEDFERRDGQNGLGKGSRKRSVPVYFRGQPRAWRDFRPHDDELFAHDDSGNFGSLRFFRRASSPILRADMDISSPLF